MTISHYRDELQARGWGVEEQAHLPFTWHALAVAGIIVGAAVIVVASRSADNPRM